MWYDPADPITWLIPTTRRVVLRVAVAIVVVGASVGIRVVVWAIPTKQQKVSVHSPWIEGKAIRTSWSSDSC